MGLLKSIWQYKCPRCREGKLFKEPFEISKPLNMNKRCEVCSLDFEPEPGYYFGAMFISYIWTGFTCLGIVGFCILVLGWSVEASMALLIVVTALSFFFIMRVSRSMYIHLNVKYNSEYKSTAK